MKNYIDLLVYKLENDKKKKWSVYILLIFLNV
jgi:hypothetical protein